MQNVKEMSGPTLMDSSHAEVHSTASQVITGFKERKCNVTSNKTQGNQCQIGKGQPILERHKNIIPIHISMGVYM